MPNTARGPPQASGTPFIVNEDFVSKLRSKPLDDGTSPIPKLNMPVY